MVKNITLFTFTDSLKDITVFESLGFQCKIDDVFNRAFYVELLTNTKESAIEIIQKCSAENLDVKVLLSEEDLDFTSEEYLDFIKGAE